MLTLMIGGQEAFDEATQQFVMTGGTPVELEHSLVSLSKWEAFYEKPFLGKEPKTTEETLAYVRMMAINPETPPELFERLSNGNLTTVNEYIGAKMSATWFNEPKGPNTNAREVITAEIIYYWMIALTIPFETQHWHLNRLLTLVKVCNQKNQPPKKKMNARSLAERNRQLNAQRKAQLGTSG